LKANFKFTGFGQNISGDFPAPFVVFFPWRSRTLYGV